MGLEVRAERLLIFKIDEGVRRAFSLIEMLVVMSVIGILLAILLPALSASRHIAQKVKCISQMKKIGFEFRLFADDFAVRNRGDSITQGANAFVVEDYLDQMYRVDEFWDARPAPILQYNAPSELMMCPAGPKILYRRSSRLPSRDRVWPPANVSLAINRRLLRDGKRPGVRTVTSKILNYPDVPILLDVDGIKAAAADRPPYYATGKPPFYIAPPVDRNDDYQSGRYWFPSFRHNNSLNVVFVDGHVASSRKPLEEPGWRWSYHPD